MNHVVALSGGKDSTALALALKDLEPDRDYRFVCTPTKNELPEMKEHWRKLGQLLGTPLIELPTASLMGLIYKQKALPNWRMRWCTRMIKIEPFEEYILDHLPCTVYVGIRADEVDREGVAYEVNEGVTRRYPLVEWGWGEGDVIDFLKRRNVTIPERTDCALCFFQTLHEWRQLWLNYPKLYAQGEAAEEYVGHTLRSDQRDTWPAGLKPLREEFEKGRVPPVRKMKDRKAMCSTCAR
jgi:3'-phosphoadenosine 5'-phosphosulfate sulfotransferase (PAPS reductase)/FAD synthetase